MNTVGFWKQKLTGRRFEKSECIPEVKRTILER